MGLVYDNNCQREREERRAALRNVWAWRAAVGAAVPDGVCRTLVLCSSIRDQLDLFSGLVSPVEFYSLQARAVMFGHTVTKVQDAQAAHNVALLHLVPCAWVCPCSLKQAASNPSAQRRILCDEEHACLGVLEHNLEDDEQRQEGLPCSCRAANMDRQAVEVLHALCELDVLVWRQLVLSHDTRDAQVSRFGRPFGGLD
eukprot:3216906-Prymnesium_polylepis.1